MMNNQQDVEKYLQMTAERDAWKRRAEALAGPVEWTFCTLFGFKPIPVHPPYQEPPQYCPQIRQPEGFLGNMYCTECADAVQHAILDADPADLEGL